MNKNEPSSQKKENKAPFEKDELQSMEKNIEDKSSPIIHHIENKNQPVEIKIQPKESEAKNIEKNQIPQNKFFFPEARFRALFSKKETKPIILPIEDKPQPIKEKETEVQPVKLVESVKTEQEPEKVEVSSKKENEAQPVKHSGEKIQTTKPEEPKVDPVIYKYNKNGIRTMVIRDKAFSAFKILERAGIRIEKESDYNRDLQLEAEAERKIYEPHLKRIAEIDLEIGTLEKEMFEEDQKRQSEIDAERRRVAEHKRKMQLEAEANRRKDEENRKKMRKMKLETARIKRDAATAELNFLTSLKNRDNLVMQINPNSIVKSKSLLSRDDTRHVPNYIRVSAAKYLTIKNRDKPINMRTTFEVPATPDEADNDLEFDEDEFRDLDDGEED